MASDGGSDEDEKAERAWASLERFREAIGLGPSRRRRPPPPDAAPRLPPIPEIEREIDGVPWDLLAHAYHGAGDAPQNLRAIMTAPSPDAAPSDWLWGSILHQGNLYSATAPVVWILSDLLKARPDHPCAPLILGAIQTVAEGYAWRLPPPEKEAAARDPSEDASEDAFAEEGAPQRPLRASAPGAPVWETFVDQPLATRMEDAIPDAYFRAITVRAPTLRKVLENALPAVRQSLGSADPSCVYAAAGALTLMVDALPDAPGAAEDLRRVALSESVDPGARLAAIIGLDKLGEEVSPWLDHPDRRLRVAAAMGAGAKPASRSREELAGALIDFRYLEHAFPNGAAHLDLRLRFHVLEALLSRLPASAALAEPLTEQALTMVLARDANAHTADFELGPVLAWAFAERLLPPQERYKTPPAPAPIGPLNPVQRMILGAACANDALWEERIGNRDNAFRAVDLPVEREALRALAAAGHA